MRRNKDTAIDITILSEINKGLP